MTPYITAGLYSSRVARAAICHGAFALLALSLTSSVSVSQAATASQVEALTRQLDLLRRRTDSLQKRSDSLAKALSAFINEHNRDHEAEDRNEQLKDAQEQNESRELDKRLDGIEARLAAMASGAPPNKTGGASSVMRAPFVIEDNDGSVIFRVTGGKSPRLMIGEEKGGSVELGTGSAGGGILRVRDAGNSDRVILIASDGFGQVRAMSQSHSAVLTSNDADHGALLSLFIGDKPTARMRSGVSLAGALYISTVQGDELVFAGGTQIDKGIVGMTRTGPKRRPPGALGIPSTIMGTR